MNPFRAVAAELDQLQAAERPAFSPIALALGRVLDGPAVSSKATAAKQLVETLNSLSKRASQRPRTLAVVKSLTASGQRDD